MSTPLDPTGCLAALAGLEQMTVRRLRVLLAGQSPAQAVLMGRGDIAPSVAVAALGDDLRRGWRSELAHVDVAELGERCRHLGIHGWCEHDAEFPDVFRVDPDPPAVLFVRGDLGAVDQRRVGIVGTRNATRLGLETAHELGRRLAAEEVAVVSGLAKGIDGAAHRGALGAGGRPIGVVGNGLDRPYPRQHAELWRQVGDVGVLMSEWPPGAEPLGYRFPLRNRMIAALSEVLVVVESRETGGSLGTAMAALERQVPVMAVPGSIANRAANGTNLLIRDGAGLVLDVDDVLVALGLTSSRARDASFDPRPRPRGLESQVLERCRSAPCTINEIVDELDVPIGDAAVAVARLERSGWLREAGGWLEVVAAVEVASQIAR